METTSPPLFAEERRRSILNLLEKQNKVYVPELCEFFNVSPATIRTDLRVLDNEGVLKRTHGGAVNLSKAAYEPTSDFKLSQKNAEKKRIAEYAIELIKNGNDHPGTGETSSFQARSYRYYQRYCNCNLPGT